MPHISIKAEELFHFLGFSITNSLLSTFLVLIIFFVIAYLYYQKRENKNSRFVFLIRFLTKSLYQLFASVNGEKAETFFPLLGSFFLFIILSNWFGLLPGVGSILIEKYAHGEKEAFPLLRGGTADLNTTIALAVVSVVLIQYYGIKFLGVAEYLKKFINLTNPINFFVGILEIVSEFSKILSFAFRLFGNIFAGEVLLTIVAFLVPVLASFPFLVLELFVGFIQALVFSMLTAVFLSTATAKHH